MASIAFIVGFTVFLIWIMSQPLKAYLSPSAALPSAHITTSERRRTYAHIYSNTIVGIASRINAISEKILVKQLHPLLESWANGHHAVDLVQQTRAFGCDFVSAYIFGLERGTCLFQSAGEKVKTINCFTSILEWLFWLIEIPTVTIWLHRCGVHLVPESTLRSQKRLEDIFLDLCRSAQAYNRSASDDLTVYAQLRAYLASTGLTGEILEKTVAAELLDHIIAAGHGIGTTLTYAMTQLSKNLTTQTRLRNELVASTSGQTAEHKLPFLEAVLQETMRAYQIFPGPRGSIEDEIALCGESIR